MYIMNVPNAVVVVHNVLERLQRDSVITGAKPTDRDGTGTIPYDSILFSTVLVHRLRDKVQPIRSRL